MPELREIALDAEGWGPEINNNFRNTNNQIGALLDETKSIVPAGTRVITDLIDSVSSPSAITAVAVTPATVSGTGDDTNINNNFAALATFTTQVAADLNNLRSTITANQAILENLINKQNALLAQLRAGTGVAILAANSS